MDTHWRDNLRPPAAAPGRGGSSAGAAAICGQPGPAQAPGRIGEAQQSTAAGQMALSLPPLVRETLPKPGVSLLF